MSKLAFLTAVYNEEDEIIDLIESVRPYVDTIVISDDGSTDATVSLAYSTRLVDVLVLGPHLASCEEVRRRGFARIIEDWVLILDADERISAEGLLHIRDSLTQLENDGYTHVYFTQEEYIDGKHVQTFPKIKLARRDALNLPVGIHDDVSASGEPTNLGVKVIHRKTSVKQVKREREYLRAYEQKIKEGKMTRERANQVSQWHYFVRDLKDVTF